MFAPALFAVAGLVLAVDGEFYDGGGQTVGYISVTGSDITVTNVHVSDSAPGANGVNVRGNRNTLRNLLVERAGATGVYFVSGTGHVLEDSVIRDPVTRPGQDSWGIYSATAGRVTVRRTTVHGSGFANYAPGGSALLEDNHFIVPPHYRTDCNGNPEPDGPCQCAEFGVALKTGNVVIQRNWISGYRTADPVCGGSGTPGAGISIAACTAASPCPTRNVEVLGNIISASHAGIYVSPGSSAVTLNANRLCGNDAGISDGFGSPSAIVDNEFLDNGLDLNLYGSREGPVTGNSVASEPCVDGSFKSVSLAPVPGSTALALTPSSPGGAGGGAALDYLVIVLLGLAALARWVEDRQEQAIQCSGWRPGRRWARPAATRAEPKSHAAAGTGTTDVRNTMSSKPGPPIGALLPRRTQSRLVQAGPVKVCSPAVVSDAEPPAEELTLRTSSVLANMAIRDRRSKVPPPVSSITLDNSPGSTSSPR